MSALRDRLDDYVALRRSMGFVMKESSLLVSFVRYMDQRETSRVTTDLAVSWAVSSTGGLAVTRSQRLGVVRAFSVYLHALDPAHEVPPVDLLPGPYTRITPYIYCEADIAALLAAAGSLPPSWRGLTYRTLIGLLAATGIRLGEALGLNDDDLDHHRSVMTVRHTKREIAREVPLHHSVLEVLVDYAAARDRVFPARDSNSLLVSTLGRRLGACTVDHTFARLVGAAGLVIPLGRRRPRAHDLRHTYAVRILMAWHLGGVDVDVAMPGLSKAMGHANPASTYWYLQAVPELFEVVAARVRPAFEFLA